MDLRQKLSDDLKDAMRNKDEQRKTTIRLVIAGINKAETELDSSGERVKLDDKGILAIIAKEAKIRQESIFEFDRGGRQDLVDEAKAEQAILQEYLPQQLDRQAIEKQARQVIADVGATDSSDLGKVMRPLMAKLRGQADGRLVNQVVRELLSG